MSTPRTRAATYVATTAFLVTAAATTTYAVAAGADDRPVGPERVATPTGAPAR